jgi:hypothetical protein
LCVVWGGEGRTVRKLERKDGKEREFVSVFGRRLGLKWGRNRYGIGLCVAGQIEEVMKK